jgi:hypothetical protein
MYTSMMNDQRGIHCVLALVYSTEPTLRTTKYIHIKSTTVYVPSRRNWDSPTPSLASECAPSPTVPRGEAHSRAGDGLGESQLRRHEKSLALCLLCPVRCTHICFSCVGRGPIFAELLTLEARNRTPRETLVKKQHAVISKQIFLCFCFYFLAAYSVLVTPFSCLCHSFYSKQITGRAKRGYFIAVRVRR